MTPRPVLRVGLTGGIASGKTTVAGFLSELGAYVVDADRIAHELLAPGGRAVDAVVSRFGTDVLDDDGGIDRAALGRLVFADPDARHALEAIVHPAVREEMDRLIEAYRQTEAGSPVAVVDAALLVETGRHQSLDRLIVLRCGRAVQLSRLEERGGLTREEAEARLDAQAPLAEKLAVADYVIDTETDLDETRRQTERVWERILADFEARYGDPDP
jgi:dephospho-CoA kinase